MFVLKSYPQSGFGLPGMNLRNFFSELQRRNVIRFAGLYLVGVTDRADAKGRCSENRKVKIDPPFQKLLQSPVANERAAA